MKKEFMYEEVAMVLASNLEVVKEVCEVASLDVENLFAVDDEDARIKFCADVVRASESMTDNEEVEELLRLKQLSGLQALFKDADFSKSWV